MNQWLDSRSCALKTIELFYIFENRYSSCLTPLFKKPDVNPQWKYVLFQSFSTLIATEADEESLNHAFQAICIPDLMSKDMKVIKDRDYLTNAMNPMFTFVLELVMTLLQQWRTTSMCQTPNILPHLVRFISSFFHINIPSTRSTLSTSMNVKANFHGSDTLETSLRSLLPMRGINDQKIHSSTLLIVMAFIAGASTPCLHRLLTHELFDVEQQHLATFEILHLMLGYSVMPHHFNCIGEEFMSHIQLFRSLTTERFTRMSENHPSLANAMKDSKISSLECPLYIRNGKGVMGKFLYRMNVNKPVYLFENGFVQENEVEDVCTLRLNYTEPSLKVGDNIYGIDMPNLQGATEISPIEKYIGTIMKKTLEGEYDIKKEDGLMIRRSRKYAWLQPITVTQYGVGDHVCVINSTRTLVDRAIIETVDIMGSYQLRYDNGIVERCCHENETNELEPYIVDKIKYKEGELVEYIDIGPATVVSYHIKCQYDGSISLLYKIKGNNINPKLRYRTRDQEAILHNSDERYVESQCLRPWTWIEPKERDTCTHSSTSIVYKKGDYIKTSYTNETAEYGIVQSVSPQSVSVYFPQTRQLVIQCPRVYLQDIIHFKYSVGDIVTHLPSGNQIYILHL
ncbi:MAG: hypothetical protein Sylvanvirus23_1, partial [Sylvanvirus sp.]